MPRATTSATLQCGLVALPLKLYTACSSERVAFVQINSKTNVRLKQQMYDPSTEQVVPKEDIVKGYEISKGSYVTFTPDEVKSLEADRTNIIDVQEFVPFESVDLVGVEKTYYLGPNKGGDKAYQLFAEILSTKQVVAVARWAARGKNQLVIVRPYNGGLILHQMYYANEVRSFEEVMESVGKFEIQDRERDLAEKLIDQLLIDAFDAAQYKDEYAARVLEAANTKQAGGELVLDAPENKQPTLDMFDALKATLDQAKQRKLKRNHPRKRRQAVRRQVRSKHEKDRVECSKRN